MTILILLLTCLVLSPWSVQFFRYVTTRPEAIPTPTWMVTTSILFLFLAPLISGLIFGENFTGHERAAGWIAYTTVVYWLTFTAVYSLLSGRRRTVEPDGPRGMRTALGNLKMAALSMTIRGAFMVYVPLVLVKLYFIKAWGLGVSGGGLAMMQLPYYLVILLLLTQSGTGPFTAVFASHLFGRSSFGAKLLCILPLAANLGFTVIAGRRPVLMYFGMLALGLMWTGRRRNVLAIAGLGLAVWFMLAVFSPVFLRARELWRTPNGPDVLTAFKIAINEGGTEGSNEQLQKGSEENIKARVNSYSFWLGMYEPYLSKPLGGLILLQAILMNIPRMFIGIYKYSLGPTEEYLLGTEDIANNVSMSSFIDLGPVGPVIFGATMAGLFFVIDVLGSWIAARNKYIALLIAGSLIEPLLSPENDVMGYFGLLRNVLTFCFFTVLATFVVGRLPVAADGRRVTAGARFAGMPHPATPVIQ